jgi:outer membrane protein insertion porin family
VALSLIFSLALRAQNPASDQQPAAGSSAQAKQEKPAPKPAETSKEQPAPTSPGRLETPPPAQEAPAKPEPKPGEKPATETPQKLQLETPKEAPAAPKAPEAAKPAAPAPSEEAAKPVIQDILFRGARRTPVSTLRARIFSHAGDAYDENALERDFMALWNTGFFDDIRLEVSDGDKGKIVTFYVREKKLIRQITYKGLSSVQESDVLDEFKKRKVGLTIQGQYDPVVIKRAEVILREMLAAHGKMFATVRHRTRNIPPNSVALTFVVAEGPKVKVGRVSFRGNTVFSALKLERAMKYSRPVGAPPWFYWFHRTYDKDRIEADLENIRDLYRDHGYYYALPKDPETKMVDTQQRWPFFFWSWGRGKRVDLTISIEEGAQYRLGKFVIRGNKLIKQEILARFLQMKPGDVFALGKVRKAIENYTKLYGQFGYINFVASPYPEVDNKRHLINLALDFEEDKQFFVHRIEFSGNTKTRDKVIRRELIVDEGGIFNSSWWDLSILRINQLGFFDTVKKEDYEIRQNSKESTVDITLKVKEKGKNSIGFQGGVSGLAGNFVGVNYATNNFLGLGETLSVQAQWGTYQKLYQFGFTEPYLRDRAVTTGFTIFKSDYRYDQLRQTAFLTGINPNLLAQSFYGQFAQNFQQNSAGFTLFASYPPRRLRFGRLGLTYSFSKSSLQAFNAASQAYFEAINFRGLAGPNALSGIVSSQVQPTFTYNTINNAWNPTSGKYLFAAVGFSGSFMGGNVNTIAPVIEAKYFRPVAHVRSEKPHAIGLRLLTSTVSGYGGRVPPPFSRFYIGGEYDIRGFDIRTISPVAFYPTITQVCNLDNAGNPIYAVGPNGASTTTCGSFTSFPMYTPIFPGGDTEVVTNFEYRVPIVGPVTAAYFVDTGSAFVWRTSQLQIVPTALSQIEQQYPSFPLPKALRPVGSTNFRPRSSTGLDIQVILPIVNAPFHVFYGYNWLRMDTIITPPQALPSPALFPNAASYNNALRLFLPLRVQDRKGRVGFTVQRTF